MDGDRVAPVEEIPVDSNLLFTVVDEAGEEREAILVRVEEAVGDGSGGVETGSDGDGSSGVEDVTGDRSGGVEDVTGDRSGGVEGDPGDRQSRGVAAWFNYCQHFTHIKLDKGSGAEFRGGEVVCTNHGAMFDADSGRCTYGPCEGAYLESIDVEVRDGAVYLTEEGYGFGSLGPTETDPVDLTSKSNIEF